MIMHDVDAALTANGEFLPWLHSQNQPFYDLAYADDTKSRTTAPHFAACRLSQQLALKPQEMRFF